MSVFVSIFQWEKTKNMEGVVDGIFIIVHGGGGCCFRTWSTPKTVVSWFLRKQHAEPYISSSVKH
ncbi:hypothetical protein CCR75_000292 [Bremia lactucae]|uniref:Uncharacterized protein n=1 Tax=Bremia lactucae TaxID=4779 RepID=A0A976IE41_BRELC|nr:hypothetical protein CCR75_000292 [Bremia lactucae]